MSEAQGKAAKPGLSAWSRSAVTLVVILAVLVLGIWGWGQVLQSGWNTYAARLSAAGEPLTFLEIDAARPPLADDQNAALLLESLPMALSALDDREAQGRVLLIERRDEYDLFTGLPRGMLDASRAFRDANRDTLVQLQALRNYTQGRPRRDWSVFALEILAPDLTQSRNFARLMTLDAWLNLVDGDVDAATPYPTLIWNLGRVYQDDPLLISALVRHAIDATGIRLIESVLRATEVSEDVLLEWNAQLARLDAEDHMKWALRGERACQISLLEDLAAGRVSAGSGVPPALSRIATMNVFLRPSQRKAAELLSPLVEASGDPLTLMKRARTMDEQAGQLSARHMVLKIVTPSLSRAMMLNARLHAEFRCARAALAAERYRLAHGRLPESLDLLVPDYLEALPIDPFDGQPLKMAITSHGVTIYAATYDENRRGRPPETDPAEPKSDARFRLYRPEQRGVLIIDEPVEE